MDAPTISIPGPTLVLERGEPVEITLVNHLRYVRTPGGRWAVQGRVTIKESPP